MRTGYALVLASALMYGAFPVITKLSYTELRPLTSAGWSMLFACLLLGPLVGVRKRWKEVIDRRALPSLIGMTLIIVVGVYGVIFLSLQLTSASNVAILSTTEMLTTILFLTILTRHERFSASRAWGSIAMFLGVILILFGGATTPNWGDALILIAPLLAPWGNVLQKRARTMVSGEAMYFFRSLVGGSILLFFALVFEPLPSAAAFGANLPLLLLNGIVIFGISKLLWVEGLHRMPITTAIPLVNSSAVFTMVFAFLILHEPIRIHQVLALIPVFFGIWLLTRVKGKALKDLPEEP
jgi:drug/metabolite transporter (DMT)-like permease